MKKRILSIVLALLMLMALLPAAFAEWTVPDGYSEYEYNKLAAFFELEDENGVKNGTKLNEEYDVNDPATWGDGWIFMPVEEPYQVMFFYGRKADLVGTLDVSGFTTLDCLYLDHNRITAIDASDCPVLSDVEVDNGTLQSLDFSNCESLNNLICDDNQLTSLNVSGCTSIMTGIFCDHNLLTELDVSSCEQMVTLVCHDNLLEKLNVSNCASLSTLNAENNALREIDLSDCVSLQVLNLSGNYFRSIDLSPCPELHLDSVTALGPGYVGYWETLMNGGSHVEFFAYPYEGAKFLGWYDAQDQLLSTEADWDASSELDSIGTAVTAKFRWDLPDGIYLVGSMNEWAPTEADKFVPNPESSGEYMLETTLAVDDQIKVIESVGGNWTWYSGNNGDNYTVDAAHAGDVTVYFRSTYNPAWSDFGGFFYIVPKPAPATCTVTFDLNYEDSEPFTIQVPVGGTLDELPTAERVSSETAVWTFLGWYDTAASGMDVGTGNRITTETVFTEDTTVYAHWRLPGDVNGDGRVNGADLVLLAEYIKARGVDVNVVPGSVNIDGSEDGRVNGLDLIRLAEYIKARGIGVVIH